MSPEANGRFCGACQKTVLDFTAMADHEILQWFANHGKGSACGRFRPDQLNRPMVTPRENKTPKLSMTIPANLTPGTYVVRVSHPALTKCSSQEIVIF